MSLAPRLHYLNAVKLAPIGVEGALHRDIGASERRSEHGADDLDGLLTPRRGSGTAAIAQLAGLAMPVKTPDGMAVRTERPAIVTMVDLDRGLAAAIENFSP